MKEALLYASTFIIEDGLMWFVPTRYNYLCCYNLTTEKVEKKIRLPEGNYYPRMYDNILNHEGKLYLIPFNGSDVLIFDKNEEQFQKICMEPFNTIKYKFCAAAIYQNAIYMFPERVSLEIDNPYIVIRVDLTGQKEVYVVELNVPIVPAGKACYEVFGRQCFVVGNCVYILLQRTNKILEYHLEKNVAKIYEVSGSENRYAAMYMEQNTFYFIDQEGDVTIWDKVENEISKYKNEIPGYAVEKKELFAAYSASFKYEDSIYFIPRFANKAIMFRKSKVQEVWFSNSAIISDVQFETWEYYLHFSLNQDILYLWNRRNYKCYIINLENKKCIDRWIKASFSKEDLRHLYTEYNENQWNGNKEDEASYLRLEIYLNMILSQENELRKSRTIDNISKKILKIITD